MAKVPYTKVSRKAAEGLSRVGPNHVRPTCSHDDEIYEHTEVTTILRSAMQNLNNNYRSTGNSAHDTAEACADGSCDTVYVPVIMYFHMYNEDPISNSTFYSGISQGGSRVQKYNRTREAFEELNKVFAGIDTNNSQGFDTLNNAQIVDTTQVDYSMAGINTVNHYTKIKDFGYYTGAVIYDESSRLYVDEFVSHKELRDLYPNIQFYFPTKIKTEHLLGGFYKEFTGLKVGLHDLVDHLDIYHQNKVHKLLEQEYFYFAEDYPGAIFNDSKLINVEFVTKLNVIQQIIYTNNLDMTLAINPQTGPTYSVYNIDSNVEGEDMLTLVNHQGSRKTIFGDLALTYDGSEFTSQDTWSTGTTKGGWRDPLAIKGPAKAIPSILYHEFGHLMGRIHAWQAPAIGGAIFKEERKLRTSDGIFANSFSINYDVALTNDEFGNIIIGAHIFPGKGSIWGYEEDVIAEKYLLNADLKPPFSYTVKNPKYKTALRNYTVAEAEWQHWYELQQQAQQSGNYFVYGAAQLSTLYPSHVNSNNVEDWVSTHVDLYQTRRMAAMGKLSNTPEYISSDFSEISEEEKEYIEFVFNKFIPHITSDFGRKNIFQSADYATVDASIHSRSLLTLSDYNRSNIPNINNLFDVFDPQSVDGQRTGMDPITDLAADALTGVSSFWGGAYIIKNPPALASEYIVDGMPEIVTRVHEQKYIYALRFISGNYTYSEAEIKADEMEGWRLPNQAEGEVIASSIRKYNVEQDNQCLTPSPSLIYNLAINSSNATPSNQNTIDENPDLNLMPTWNCWTSEIPYSGPTGRQVISVSACPQMSPNTITNLVNKSNSLILIKRINLLEDDTIVKQLVVNPTNDDGTRKGPNVTTYIPFCILGASEYNPHPWTPNKTNISLNTKYDHFWMHNFNAYNDLFPVYPDNTPVDNLLDPEFCPCLHNTQIYYNGDGTTYEFKIIGGGDNAWAAHAVMVGGSRAHNDVGKFKDEFTSFRTRSSSSWNIGDNSAGNPAINRIRSAYSQGHIDRIDNNLFRLATRLTSSWLIFTTNKYKDGYASPNLRMDVPLHKYSDPDQTILKLPFFNGYCGFGWGSILPKVYEISPKAYFNSYLDFVDSDPTLNNIYSEAEIEFISNMPDEYNLYPADFAWQNDLRLASRRAGATIASNNVSTRYAIGSTNPDASLYNPLTQYFSQTSANGVYDMDDSSNYKPPLFDMTIKEHYYEDLYGEYNPLYMTDAMYYLTTDSVHEQRYWSNHTVKATNYLFNYQDLPIINNLNIIYQEDIGSDLTYSDESTNTSSPEKSDFERYHLYVRNSVLGVNIESEVGGCNDPTMYNYNAFATYNNGTCIERKSGCMQTWADNYDSLANTEDGSCYSTICTNPDAIGDYGAGFNQSMIDTLTQYGTVYSTNAIIEAANELVNTLNTDNLSVCQFTAIPRPAIIKLVCIPTLDLAASGFTICNDNPVIRYIADSETGDIYNYTNNPVVIETPLLEFINTSRYDLAQDKIIIDDGILTVEEIESTITKPRLLNAGYNATWGGDMYRFDGLMDNGQYSSHYMKAIKTYEGNSFPSPIEGDDLVSYTGDSYNHISHLVSEVCFSSDSLVLAHNQHRLRSINNASRYNCVENPILPDGSGGCFLYSPNSPQNDDAIQRSSACSVAQIEEVTYMNCDNVVLFSPDENNGGYITDLSLLTATENLATLVPCSESLIPEQQYIIGGELSSSSIAQTNGEIITYSQLPKYSESQLHSISGYPESVLDSNLILEQVEQKLQTMGARRLSSSKAQKQESHVVTSSPKQLLFSKYFYTENGEGYSGPFVVTFDFRDESAEFKTHGRNSNSKLYYRNELLRRPNTKLTKEEALAKKMHKVINKIINLPIFTDN